MITAEEARERAFKIMEERESQEKKTRQKDGLEDWYQEELLEEFRDRQSAINFRVISSIYEAILILLTFALTYVYFFGTIIVDSKSLIGYFIGAGIFRILTGLLERRKKQKNKEKYGE